MGVFSVTLKTKSREDITDQFQSLSPCIVHNRTPTIFKIVAGRRNYLHFIAVCNEDSCGKIADSAESVVSAWNRWNPSQTDKQ